MIKHTNIMKHISIISIIAIVCLSITISCSRADEKYDKSVDGQEVTVHLRVQASQDPATSAVFDDEFGLQWAVGDRIFWKNTDGGSNCEYTLTSSDIKDQFEASFKTVIPGLSEGNVHGWFKYNTHPNLGNDEAVFSDLDSKIFKYGTPNQAGTTLTYHQSEAGTANPAIFSLQSSSSSSSILPETLTQGTSEITLDMQILGTIFRVLPFTNTYNDEVVQKITFSSLSTIAGTVKYEADGTYTAPYWANINKVIIELDSDMALTTATSKALSKGIYFALPPTSTPISGYEYVVTTDKAEYVFTSDKDLSVGNNKVKNIPLNLDKARRVTAADWPVDAYFYPTNASKFSGMTSYISSYVVAGDKRSATVTMSDNLHHGGALYFDGGFNDILENKVYVESFDTGLAGFGNEPGFVFNFDIYENTTGAERTMDVVFYAFAESNNAKGYFTLHIVQPAATLFYVDRTSQTVAADATSATINVTAQNASWTAEVISGSATISPTSGDASGAITVSFAENVSTSDENTYVVRVSTTAAVATQSYDVTITQSAVGASGGSGPEFRFGLSWSANANNAQFGFGLNSNGAGHYATLNDIAYADGSEVDLTNPATVAAIIAEATDNLDPAGSGVAGNGASFVQDAIKFVLCGPVGANNSAKTIGLGIQTPSSGTAFAKLVIYSSDGVDKTEALTWFIWCP